MPQTRHRQAALPSNGSRRTRPRRPSRGLTNIGASNGLLRQYFAKGTDLSVFPADYLDYVATKLNTRPRKTLGWNTPAEALDELLSNPSKPPAVAFTA